MNSLQDQVNNDNIQAINTFINNYIVKNIKQSSNQLFQGSATKYIQNIFDGIFKSK